MSFAELGKPGLYNLEDPISSTCDSGASNDWIIAS